MPRELSHSVPPLGVSYSAHFEPDGKRFTVYAVGHNRTTGFKTFFQVDPELILPAIVDFINIPPTGPAGNVILPFAVQITLVAATVLGGQQKIVTVHDVGGSHSVPIM
jgi:hypothetical protein